LSILITLVRIKGCKALWPEGGAIKPVAFHIGLGDPLLADATAAQGD
jgi:hypothetical protein